MSLVFHEYWRSGAAWRVRIALALKAVPHSALQHDLLRAEHRDAAYTALNPQGLVPALETPDGLITQSLAILEWLEETHPSPALLPESPLARAQVRAQCALIACDIHPLQNLRVQQWLKALDLDTAPWNQRWIGDGLAALETLVAAQGEGWCHGSAPSLADCLLLPQLYSARRYSVDLTPYPHLLTVEARALAHPDIARTHPDHHPHAPR